jgi:hypothetical protein
MVGASAFGAAIAGLTLLLVFGRRGLLSEPLAAAGFSIPITARDPLCARLPPLARRRWP